MTHETGCYHLVYHLPEAMRVRVGALGTFELPEGWYVYTGSAFGPGGLGARVARHCACARSAPEVLAATQPGRRSSYPTPRWHVDYLGAVAHLVEVVLLPAAEPRECEHARMVLGMAGASVPVPRFGSSDCCCPAHLVHFPWRPHFFRSVESDVG